ncbi:MAG: hypothetical protein U0R17_05355 [Acidimicrobiia bacterium]
MEAIKRLLLKPLWKINNHKSATLKDLAVASCTSMAAFFGPMSAGTQKISINAIPAVESDRTVVDHSQTYELCAYAKAKKKSQINGGHLISELILQRQQNIAEQAISVSKGIIDNFER